MIQMLWFVFGFVFLHINVTFPKCPSTYSYTIHLKRWSKRFIYGNLWRMGIFKSVFKNETIFCRTAVELQKECEHPKDWDLKVGVLQWEWQTAETWDTCHLASTEHSATQGTVSLTKKLALVPTAKLRPMGQIFCPRGEAGQRCNLIYNPQGIDFSGNKFKLKVIAQKSRLWRKATARISINVSVGDKAYLGGCPHFSGEK